MSSEASGLFCGKLSVECLGLEHYEPETGSMDRY